MVIFILPDNQSTMATFNNGSCISSVLLTAAENGHLGIVEYTISHGADVNWTRTQFNSLPLSEAAENGHIDVVRYLVSQGADINWGGYYDSYLPMSSVPRNSHIDVIRYLVSQGANINVPASFQSLLSGAAVYSYGAYPIMILRRFATYQFAKLHRTPYWYRRVLFQQMWKF